MKNFTTTAKALALSLLCALPVTMSAGKNYDDHEYRDADESMGQPLVCGGFNFQIQGGVAPLLWNKPDCFLLANCLSATTVCNVAQLTPLGALPKFRSLYKLPWDVGFTVGYAVSDNIQLFFEFDYRQAKAKNSGSNSNCCVTGVTTTTLPTSLCSELQLCYTTSVTSAGTTTFLFSNLSRYKSYSGHVGASWYTPRYWCESVAFFIGLKAGFVHHKAIDVTINQTVAVGTAAATVSTSPYPFACVPLFHSNTTVSTGALVGLDWSFWNRLSFVFQVEVLGQGPLRSSRNLGNTSSSSCASTCDDSCGPVVPTCVNLSTTAVTGTGLVGPRFNSEIVFPILVGLKYYF